MTGRWKLRRYLQTPGDRSTDIPVVQVEIESRSEFHRSPTHQGDGVVGWYAHGNTLYTITRQRGQLLDMTTPSAFTVQDIWFPEEDNDELIPD